MLITMLHTRRGCSDGFTVRQYKAGEKYDVPGLLAQHFLDQGWAYNSEPEDSHD